MTYTAEHTSKAIRRTIFDNEILYRKFCSIPVFTCDPKIGTYILYKFIMDYGHDNLFPTDTPLTHATVHDACMLSYTT